VSHLIILGGLDDALQLFRAFGPGEGVAVFVVAGKEAAEQILQILLGSLNAMRQRLTC
jgi:hypothetical protein